MSQELRSLNTSFLESSQTQGKAIRLPSEGRQALKDRIEVYLVQLERSESNRQKMVFLQLRKKLIDSEGLSVKRIDHLQKIFLYYCTHIFKTGKHMTFERLQYEKSHLAIQRFFMFLKDFGLTSAFVQGQLRQIVNKSQLILVFKRVSFNCKDLNFEQFIACLDKLAILYFDSKNNYSTRKSQLQKGREERKEQYLKSIQKRKEWQRRLASRTQELKQFISRTEGSNLLQSYNKQKVKKQARDGGQAKQKQKRQVFKILNAAEDNDKEKRNQNDDLVKQMINDLDIQDPLQQVRNSIRNTLQEPKEETAVDAQNNQISLQSPNIKQQQSKIGTSQIKSQPEQPNNQNIQPISLKSQLALSQGPQALFVLTPQEKIEYFYQLIDVDNSVSFKQKMRQLNLPIFQLDQAGQVRQPKHRRVLSHLIKKPEPTDMSQQYQQLKSDDELEQQRRLTELRTVIQQKKERDRGNSPQVSRQLYESSNNKSSERQTIPHKQRQLIRKGVQIKDLQTDLSSLSKMPMQDIKFISNPTGSYQIGRQADPYLQQYFSVKRTYKSEKRINSAVEQADQYTHYLLDKIKKRVRQIQIREKNRQAKYAFASDVSSDHQIHKNRLLQKMLRIHQK